MSVFRRSIVRTSAADRALDVNLQWPDADDDSVTGADRQTDSTPSDPTENGSTENGSPPDGSTRNAPALTAATARLRVRLRSADELPEGQRAGRRTVIDDLEAQVDELRTTVDGLLERIEHLEG